jgi:hypothetical protein
MTIEELYNKLEDRFFQDTDTGSIFYNVYIFQYKAEDEYEIRDQIHNLRTRLKRPNNNLDILAINLFEEFCDFLDHKSFGNNPSMLNYLLAKEEQGISVTNVLIQNATNEDFFKSVHDKIERHIGNDNQLKKSFVFLYGIGQIYPYLRTNTFLSNFERYNKGEKYKLIVFYPGHSVENSFSLFNRLKDDNTYRSIKLIEPENFVNP